MTPDGLSLSGNLAFVLNLWFAVRSISKQAHASSTKLRNIACFLFGLTTFCGYYEKVWMRSQVAA